MTVCFKIKADVRIIYVDGGKYNAF